MEKKNIGKIPNGISFDKSIRFFKKINACTKGYNTRLRLQFRKSLSVKSIILWRKTGSDCARREIRPIQSQKTLSQTSPFSPTFPRAVSLEIRRNSFVLLLARHRYRELRERGPTGLSINRDFQNPSSRNISESSVFENWPWHETWISDAKSMRASLTYSWQALTYLIYRIKESSTNENFIIKRHCKIPL